MSNTLTTTTTICKHIWMFESSVTELGSQSLLAFKAVTMNKLGSLRFFAFCFVIGIIICFQAGHNRIPPPVVVSRNDVPIGGKGNVTKEVREAAKK